MKLMKNLFFKEECYFLMNSHLLTYILRQGLLPVKGLEESATQWDVIAGCRVNWRNSVSSAIN